MNQKIPFLSLLAVSAILFSITTKAQTRPVKPKKTIRDTTIRLDSVTIKDNKSRHLLDVQGTYLFAGKKTYSLTPDAGKANLSGSNIRQIFATIPGVNVWELSGNGFQMNIGTRGTDTHRSNETNVRQNGYITNSDIFGYPEDHYTPQYDAVEQIQVLRGAAALQFGSQFGGMVNYKIKEGDHQ
jgi:Fe(3+) dicitrate transport protein